MKMKKIFAAKIFVIILVLMGSFSSFNFSSQSAEESGALSDSLIYRTLSHFEGFNALTMEQREAAVEELSFYVRKAAHMTLFFAIAFSCIAAAYVWRVRRINAFLMCATLAASDELHQAFVPGRSCEIRDVCVDLSGALIAHALVLILIKRRAIDDRFSLTYSF